LGHIAASGGAGGLRRIDIPQFGPAREFIIDGRRLRFVPVIGTALMAQYLPNSFVGPWLITTAVEHSEPA